MPKKRQNEAKKQDAPKTDIFEDVLNNDTKSSSVEQKPASRVRSPSMQIFAKCWSSVSKTRRMCFFILTKISRLRETLLATLYIEN